MAVTSLGHARRSTFFEIIIYSHYLASAGMVNEHIIREACWSGLQIIITSDQLGSHPTDGEFYRRILPCGSYHSCARWASTNCLPVAQRAVRNIFDRDCSSQGQSCPVSLREHRTHQTYRPSYTHVTLIGRFSCCPRCDRIKGMTGETNQVGCL